MTITNGRERGRGCCCVSFACALWLACTVSMPPHTAAWNLVRGERTADRRFPPRDTRSSLVAGREHNADVMFFVFGGGIVLSLLLFLVVSLFFPSRSFPVCAHNGRRHRLAPIAALLGDNCIKLATCHVVNRRGWRSHARSLDQVRLGGAQHEDFCPRMIGATVQQTGPRRARRWASAARRVGG